MPSLHLYCTLLHFILAFIWLPWSPSSYSVYLDNSSDWRYVPQVNPFSNTRWTLPQHALSFRIYTNFQPSSAKLFTLPFMVLFPLRFINSGAFYSCSNGILRTFDLKTPTLQFFGPNQCRASVVPPAETPDHIYSNLPFSTLQRSYAHIWATNVKLAFSKTLIGARNTSHHLLFCNGKLALIVCLQMSQQLCATGANIVMTNVRSSKVFLMQTCLPPFYISPFSTFSMTLIPS